jgi:O-antigen ligase
VSPAPWDMRWLQTVVLEQGIQSFGTPEPQQFRLFGPFTSPLAFALVLSVGIVCWAFSDARLWWRIAAIATMVVPLLLTQVRTSVFALALTLPIVALLHYRQRAVVPLVLIAGAVAAIPIILEAVSPGIVNRFSLSDINADTSYNSRLHLLDTNVESVFGMGGGPGASARGSIVTDNGYLATFIEFGLLGGALFLVLLIVALLRAGDVALRGQATAERALPLALVLLFLLSEASAPVIQGEQSLVFWVALASIGALGATGSDRRSGTAAARRAGPAARKAASTTASGLSGLGQRPA